jgi:hypothetical protein
VAAAADTLGRLRDCLCKVSDAGQLGTARPDDRTGICGSQLCSEMGSWVDSWQRQGLAPVGRGGGC